jgi:hypothetical protein
MLFRAVTSVAFMAAAANAAVAPKPYKLAKMSVPGLSLMARDTNGYMPDEATCSEGDTCEAACGAGYDQCPSNDAQTHCFNPTANQSCCSDGTGNSCEAGFYCTHDHSLQTWCCPEEMGLEECASAYSVEGGLETAASTTSSAPETTSTSVAPTTTTTTAAPTTTTSASSTPTPSSSSTPVVTSTPVSTPCSSTYTPTWTPGANSTIPLPTVSWTNVVPPPAATDTPTEPQPTEQPGSGASMAGTSLSLILAVAGVAALL